MHTEYNVISCYFKLSKLFWSTGFAPKELLNLKLVNTNKWRIQSYHVAVVHGFEDSSLEFAATLSFIDLDTSSSNGRATARRNIFDRFGFSLTVLAGRDCYTTYVFWAIRNGPLLDRVWPI